MQGSLLIRIVFLGIVSVAVLSCSSKKAAMSTAALGKEVSRAERLRVLRQMDANRLYFNTFSGRAKSKIAINRDSYDVTANVRIERDKAIWISVTALMGIEAARVLITPDSVKVINRLQAEYISKPFEYLYNFTNDELDFFSLQELLVGNVVHQTVSRDTEVWTSESGYLLRSQHNDLQCSVKLDTNYRPTYTLLNDVIRNQRMEAYYADYQFSEAQVFPSHVKISIAAEAFKLQSEMHYSRLVYNEALDMPFTIPTRYKAIQ